MLLSIFWLLLWTSYVQALGPAMNTDNISKTCSSEQARIITRALNDVDELIKATFPVTGSKDVFIKYFGTGWAVVSSFKRISKFELTDIVTIGRSKPYSKYVTS
jgi:hypothetical protein